MDSHVQLAGTQDWACAGTMGSAVPHASGVEPLVVGKPNSTLMDLVVKASGITRNQRYVTLMQVGDRLDTDIQWAKSCGAGSLLVLSGCTSAAQVEEPGTVPGSLLPLLYVDSVADLLSIKDKVPSTWGSVGDSCTVS